MNKAKVILLSVAMACLYGVIHDQITVRLSLEYFTVAHPRWFPTASPTLLGLYWGLVTTVGLGVVMGMVLALVSQSGDSPPWPIPRLARLLLWLVGAMALGALLAGGTGYFMAKQGFAPIPMAFGAVIARSQHNRFMAALFAHLASYVVGLGGGALVCYRVWSTRGRPQVMTLLPRSKRETARVLAIAAIAAVVLWLRLRAR